MRMERFVGSQELFFTEENNTELVTKDFLKMIEVHFFKDCHVKINNSSWIFKRANEIMRIDGVLICSFKIKESNTELTWWGIEN